jgi:serine protease inhibitor ecotin
LMDDVLDQVLEAALVEAVAKSENKIDDILVAALYPQLEAVLKSKVREAWESIPA